MTTPQIEITVKTSGPLFDGMAESAILRYINELLDEVAQTGYEMIQRELPRVIRVYTGRYAHSITVDRLQSERERLIRGDRIIYGPWLEGVGSRNFPVTRFKGYFTFRRESQELAFRVPEIAETLLRDKYLEEMQ